MTGIVVHRFDRYLLGHARRWRGCIGQVHRHSAVLRPEGEGLLLVLLHPDRELVPCGIGVPWGLIRPRAGERVIRDGRQFQLETGGPGRRRMLNLAGEGVSLSFKEQSVRTGPGLSVEGLRALSLPVRTRALLGLGGLPAGGLERRWMRKAGRALGNLVARLCRTGRVPRTERKRRSGPSGPEGPTSRPHAATGEGRRRARPRHAVDLYGNAGGGGIEDLVGLGTGSTPAGDDILLGVAAAAWRFAGEDRLRREALEGYLDALGGIPAGATTETSLEMLRHARRGAFPEPLLRFVATLAEHPGDARRVEREAALLARSGGQSGCDMLAGAMAMACAVAARLEVPA